MIKSAKDALSSRAARTYLNRSIARYGEVLELAIDSRQRTITATCLLRGESTPVHIRARYRVLEADGKKFLRLVSCQSDRAWLEAAIEDLCRARPIELPAWASAVV